MRTHTTQVRTSEGIELARCTLLSGYGITLLDVLVLPPNPVLDYCTQVR
jgi:hypothetical protein